MVKAESQGTLRKTHGGLPCPQKKPLTTAILVRSVSAVGVSVAVRRSGYTFPAVTGKLLRGTLGGLGLVCGAERNATEPHLAVKTTRNPKPPAAPICPPQSSSSDMSRQSGRRSQKNSLAMHSPFRQVNSSAVQGRISGVTEGEVGVRRGAATGLGTVTRNRKTRTPERLSCLFVKPCGHLPALEAESLLSHWTKCNYVGRTWGVKPHI